MECRYCATIDPKDFRKDRETCKQCLIVRKDIRRHETTLATCTSIDMCYQYKQRIKDLKWNITKRKEMVAENIARVQKR